MSFDSTDSRWDFSHDVNLVAGETYMIGDTEVLSATELFQGILDSSGNASLSIVTASAAQITDLVATNATIDNLTANNLMFGVTSVSSNYSAQSSDYFLACDSTAGAFTITLPAGSTGKTYVIKDASGAASTVKKITIAANGAETIDGLASIELASERAAVSLIWDGSEWCVY